MDTSGPQFINDVKGKTIFWWDGQSVLSTTCPADVFEIPLVQGDEDDIGAAWDEIEKVAGEDAYAQVVRDIDGRFGVGAWLEP